MATSAIASAIRTNPAFAHDVAEGLSREQKTLPASWLYDEVGSALFEAITLLPEYGLTRADVKPGSYQVLGYITQTLNAMGAVSGDPVTFPSAAFAVPQDVNTHVSVVFDYVR